MLAVALALLVSAPAITAAPGKHVELRDEVDASAFACIGRVERVVPIELPARLRPTSADLMGREPEPATLARIRVERVLKGDPETRIVFREVWSTGIFDQSTAVSGDRCVFLLVPGKLADATPAEMAAITKETGKELILRAIPGMDGILPIQGASDREWVTCCTAPREIQAPPAVPAKPFGECVVPLPNFVDYVATLVRFDAQTVAIRAQAFGQLAHDDQPFDLRITDGGSVRLATGRSRDEKVRVFDLDAATWSTLRDALRALAADGPIVARDPVNGAKQRALSVSLDGRTIEFTETRGFVAKQLDTSTCALVASSLRAWSLVRGAVDCPACTDHRPLDETWLRR